MRGVRATARASRVRIRCRSEAVGTPAADDPAALAHRSGLAPGTPASSDGDPEPLRPGEHTGGIDVRPAEYERRVIEFLDRALLAK